MPTRNPIRNHPNTTAATGGGTLGILVVAAFGIFGVTVEPIVAAAISTATAAAAVYVGKRGIRGVISIVWRGESSKA